MTMTNLNLCCNEVCYKGTVLYLFDFWTVVPVHNITKNQFKHILLPNMIQQWGWVTSSHNISSEPSTKSQSTGL